MTLEAYALIDAPSVQEDLPDDFASASGRLDRMINDVSFQFQKKCNRLWARVTDATEILSSTGTQFLRVMHAPIITLTSVERLDDEGNVIDTYDGCYIYGDGEAGLIFRRNGFSLGGTFDPVIDPRTVYAPTPNRLRVTYTGGYITPGQVEADNSLVSTTPPDLSEAVIREVANAFRNRGRDRDADSKTTVDATITYRQGGGLLKSTQDLLKTYWLQPL